MSGEDRRSIVLWSVEREVDDRQAKLGAKHAALLVEHEFGGDSDDESALSKCMLWVTVGCGGDTDGRNE